MFALPSLQSREPVPWSHYTDFDELVPLVPKVPLEYHLLGYREEEQPGMTPYLPMLSEQPLMQGEKRLILSCNVLSVS